MLSLRKYSGGPRSFRDYGSSLEADRSAAMSLRRFISAGALHRTWQALGSEVKLGSPVYDVALVGGRFARQYSGARLRLAAGTDQVKVDEAYEAAVYVAGTAVDHERAPRIRGFYSDLKYLK